jgi:phosphatidylglycerol:prolipoprotein diacylglycerol transferase
MKTNSMLPLAYWIHDLSPFVPGLHFSENFGVRWYGLAYVLGFVGAIWLLNRYTRAGRSQLNHTQNGDLLIAIVLGVMIGGRLGSFVFYHPEDLLRNPLSFFKIWEGGMASHGGFIGVTIALWWFARKAKVSFLHVGDLVVSATPLGLMLGRVANFINGELWGKIWYGRWAVIFPLSVPEGTPLAEIPPRHPSQLYAAALEGALLLAYLQWRLWKSDVVRAQPGRLAGEFLIGYAIVRMIDEVFREPDASLLFGLSRGTFYSIFVLIAGIALVAYTRKKKTAPERRG